MNNLTNAAEKQVLRGYILEIANAAEPLGAGTEVIAAAIKKYKHNVNKDDILEGCRYLRDKGLITIEHVKNEVLQISRDIAHITSKGVDVLEGTEVVAGIELGD